MRQRVECGLLYRRNYLLRRWKCLPLLHVRSMLWRPRRERHVRHEVRHQVLLWRQHMLQPAYSDLRCQWWLQHLRWRLG